MLKLKKLFFISFYLLLTSSLFAATTYHLKDFSPIILGKVIEVSDYDTETYRILIKGYYRGCEIYPNEITAIVSKETKIVSGCDLKDLNYKIKADDNVYVELSNIMTKSIPPQSPAKLIQVSPSSQTN